MTMRTTYMYRVPAIRLIVPLIFAAIGRTGIALAGGYGNPVQFDTFGDAARAIADFILGIALPVAVIMILYAGLLYMTSGGSPEKVKMAHRALIWGAVGIAFVLVGKGLVAVVCIVLGGRDCTGVPFT
ncbi:MAG: hypothetical protein A3I44_05475 [Candidatus Sungbacteria bacterium RIFCSPLOWO2_02_FULL_51_17]|uniref:TrbC/VIRB2 family protein n=1 Tax=Candidatus Sungbacteria bacterium RIFCSPHIGHO2_02_FULL_51_29 TaxID=1802273 RepID=A0A1G2KU74_9BACT|nr:MAG: hypothetical protein A2676_06040 [Candidatus Sungbacteria bacterium RIFCSPHIGHO2_01_FULL_51_22]OHA01959.1 MAG: hypothetical protein A3C16_02355 [Candidatus Sungbacteria bacterium RIFCSPHIGHO2_02_FULL_51_29]OHA05076.1 MAG: hypothetical protein A3B29_00340 [Candidatus Sungbacteria bacterium RIFCSPLOWO2_01_FULL_51_34]OHA11145.1 MAG: hypothetical protein A3I44_05475 [Candidatus Sungbacteria bacterium RIFCSPLOWO2_02_FULL_51_17]